MKQKFSKHWKSSKQPRKQRKYKAEAPLHIKRRFLSCNLSKELRKKYSKRNAIVVKEDKVRVMRGKFKKKQGKIIRVFTKLGKIHIEGLQVKKQDGSKVAVKLQPSNLQIIDMNLDDKKRMQKITGRESKVEKQTAKEEVKEIKSDKKVEEKK